MFIWQLLESIGQAPGEFIDVALHDPVSAVLVLIGFGIIAVSVGFFAILVLGAVVEAISPSPGGQPQQPGR